MKNFKTHAAAFLILFIVFMPMISAADTISQRLFICDGIEVKCNFSALVQLAQNIIIILIEIGTVIALLLAIKIGFSLVTSAGNPAALTKAKASAFSLLKGYFVILIAWLVVYTITNALLQDGYSILGSPRTN